MTVSIFLARSLVLLLWLRVRLGGCFALPCDSGRETCCSLSVTSPTMIGLFLDFVVLVLSATSAYVWSRSSGRVWQLHGGSFPHLGQGLILLGESIFVLVGVGGSGLLEVRLITVDLVPVSL